MASTFLQGYIQETTGYIYHIDTNYSENLCNTQGWLQWKPVQYAGLITVKNLCNTHREYDFAYISTGSAK